MGIYLLLLVLVIIVPLLMLPLGFRFIDAAEKNDKKKFLYNSKRSIKDDELWTYANMLIGKIWSYAGIVLFVLNLVIYLSFSKAFMEKDSLNYIYVIISLLVSLSVILVSFIIIEIKLIIINKKEDEDI